MKQDDSKNWQKVFPLKVVYQTDLRNLLVFGFHIGVRLVLPVSYLAFVVLTRGWQIKHFTLGIVILLAFLTLSALILMAVANNFLKQFYNFETLRDSNQIIIRRLFGVPVPPLLMGLIKHARVIVEHGKLIPADHWVSWIGGPALLIIMDDSAVYLEKGNRFSRVVGSGRIFVHRDEIVRQVLDLRPQLRKGLIHAWTKDGIQVSVEASFLCQIGSGKGHDPEDMRNFTFDPIATKKAVEATSVRFEKDKGLIETSWLDGAWGRLQGILISYISGFKVDELIREDSEQGVTISSFVERHLLLELNKNLEKIGSNATDLHIKNITLPLAVKNLLIETWEAERKSLAITEEGKSKSNQTYIQLQARLQAQRSLINAIENSLENMSDEQFAQHYSLALTGLFDLNLDDPAVRLQMTEIIRETLAQFKDITQFYKNE